MKYPRLDLGDIEAFLNKIGGMEGLKKFLRNELIITPNPKLKWYEKDNLIYGSLISDGFTGMDYAGCFKKMGYNGDILNSPCLSNFMPTNEVVYDFVIIRGKNFSNESYCSTIDILSHAESLKTMRPNIELACLIRKNFSNKDIENMGLFDLVVAHLSLRIDSGDKFLGLSPRTGQALCFYQDLSSLASRHAKEWNCKEVGFVFVLKKRQIAQ